MPASQAAGGHGSGQPGKVANITAALDRAQVLVQSNSIKLNYVVVWKKEGGRKLHRDIWTTSVVPAKR